MYYLYIYFIRILKFLLQTPNKTVKTNSQRQICEVEEQQSNQHDDDETKTKIKQVESANSKENKLKSNKNMLEDH